MLHFLKLSVEDFITNFVYDASNNFEYPEGYNNDKEPRALVDYPNLEQAFWSIIEQYDNNTIHSMSGHNTRKVSWCREVVYKMSLHCKKYSDSLDCGNKDTFCGEVVAPFLYELCIRLMKEEDDDKDTNAE